MNETNQRYWECQLLSASFWMAVYEDDPRSRDVQRALYTAAFNTLVNMGCKTSYLLRLVDPTIFDCEVKS